MSNPENEKTSQMNESFYPGQQPYPMKSAMNLPPSMPPQQTVFVTNVQPVHEKDYLGYSIFTLICCCLPLGIVALIYSIKTKEANRQGDIASARKYSRRALTFDHTALGLGIASIILTIILITVFYVVFFKKNYDNAFTHYNPWKP